MNNLIQDFKISGRILARNRWQSAVIVLTLALSISALTSVVSVVNDGSAQALWPRPDRSVGVPLGAPAK